jgi:hypothetical protein
MRIEVDGVSRGEGDSMPTTPVPFDRSESSTTGRSKTGEDDQSDGVASRETIKASGGKVGRQLSGSAQDHPTSPVLGGSGSTSNTPTSARSTKSRVKPKTGTPTREGKSGGDMLDVSERTGERRRHRMKSNDVAVVDSPEADVNDLQKVPEDEALLSSSATTPGTNSNRKRRPSMRSKGVESGDDSESTKTESVFVATLVDVRSENLELSQSGETKEAREVREAREKERAKLKEKQSKEKEKEKQKERQKEKEKDKEKDKEKVDEKKEKKDKPSS